MSVLDKATGEEKIYLSVLIIGVLFTIFVVNLFIPLVREDGQLKEEQIEEQTSLRNYCESIGKSSDSSDFPFVCYRYYRGR